MLQRCRAGHAGRLSFVVLVMALGLGAAPAWSQVDTGADALLAIDLNRSTVIERIVMQWGGLVLPSGAVLDAGQLRARLSALRADRLLAASLAGTSQGLQQVLSRADATTRREARLKSLGDAAVDLTYTPLTPCRIIDTRNAVGPLQPGVTRTEAGYTATTFASQGGDVSNCGIPAAVAALALNVVAVQPSNLGFIKLWPANAAQPNASTINYDPTTLNIATGTIVPVDGANNNSFNAESPAQVQMVVDVVGYFAAPNGNGGKFFMQGGNAFGTIAALGTLDNFPIDIFVNDALSWQLRPDSAGLSPVVVGGYGSPINGNSVIGGASGAVISGGGAAGVTLLGNDCNRPCRNRITDAFGTIAGGAANIAGDDAGTATNQPFGTVAGGFSNWASGAYSSVGGGAYNAASTNYGTVPGGLHNTAGFFATVGGGSGNTASGSYATVAGGGDNTASGNGATVAGGASNIASGFSATVAGGEFNTAAGTNSFAAGYQATIPASAPGSFFWNDSQGAQSLPENAHDEFIVIATNGIGMYTYKDFSHGCALVGAAGSWTCTSDRATKSDFTDIRPRDVLARLVEMPIAQWRWKGEAETVRHVGPTAQDFRAAFGLGYDDKTITLVDSEGVALAAIQGLNQIVQEKDAMIEAQRQAIAEQQREIADLRERIGQVESVRSELDDLKRALSQLAGSDARVAMHPTP